MSEIEATVHYLHGGPERLKNLISSIFSLQQNTSQCLSIYINSKAQDPALRKTLPTRIRNAFKKATGDNYNQWEQLASTVEKQVSALTTLPPALAIFATPSKYILLMLPQEVEEIALIDQTFYTRPVVLLTTKLTPYWLILLTANRVYLWHGWNTSIYPHTHHTLAHTPDPSIVTADVATHGTRAGDITVWKERETEALFASAIKKFAKLTAHATDIPLVVVGNPKELGIFKKHLHNYPEENIITIEADATPETITTLMPQLNSALTQWREKLEERLIQAVERAFKMRRVASGIHEVWEALSQNRIDTLLIEENFKLEAWTTDLPLPAVYLDEPPPDTSATHHPDLIDDIIEIAIQKGSNVYIFREGKLNNWDRIVALLHY